MCMHTYNQIYYTRSNAKYKHVFTIMYINIYTIVRINPQVMYYNMNRNCPFIPLKDTHPCKHYNSTSLACLSLML